MSKAAEMVVSAYQAILNSSTENTLEALRHHPLPFFSEHCLTMLCQDAKELFKSQPTLVEVNKSVNIVGDLHGSIFDLLRILKLGTPDENYLFLGDYVDRGSYSVEVITLLFALAVTHPEQYTLIRGNHEFSAICSIWGFKESVMELYRSEDLFNRFVDVFSYLPLAAVVDSTILCVHGGLSRRGRFLSDIAAIQKPITDYSENLFVKDLLWADVSQNGGFYVESQRVTGCTNFGYGAVKQFLNENNLTHIIRAHEYTPTGFKKNCKGLITVFSASSYKQDGSNPSAMLSYSCESKSIRYRKYEAWVRPRRAEIQFHKMGMSEEGGFRKCTKANSWGRMNCLSVKRPIAAQLSTRAVGALIRTPILPYRAGVATVPSSRMLRLTTPITGNKPELVRAC